jgi:hypothetical protein
MEECVYIFEECEESLELYARLQIQRIIAVIKIFRSNTSNTLKEKQHTKASVNLEELLYQ